MKAFWQHISSINDQSNITTIFSEMLQFRHPIFISKIEQVGEQFLCSNLFIFTKHLLLQKEGIESKGFLK